MQHWFGGGIMGALEMGMPGIGQSMPGMGLLGSAGSDAAADTANDAGCGAGAPAQGKMAPGQPSEVPPGRGNRANLGKWYAADEPRGHVPAPSGLASAWRPPDRSEAVFPA